MRTFHAKLNGQSAVSMRCPTTTQHPLEKQVTSLSTYKNQIFFCSRVMYFSRNPSCFSTGFYAPFHKEVTCESSNIKGLLYAHETLIAAQRYDVPWYWHWDTCHMAGVHWGSRCKGFCSKEGPHYCFDWSARNPTINLIHNFGNPLGIPYLSCTT
jgi:hypothetical protein